MDGPELFVIEIAEPKWKILNETQRKALVDHELCHCFVGDDGRLLTVSHDLEEFAAIIKRYGLWREDIERFIEGAGGQTKLAFERETTGLRVM